MCFSLTGHKYHHCCPPPPLNGSSTLFATIYDLCQGPVTGAKEGGGGGSGKGAPTTPPPAQANFPPPTSSTDWHPKLTTLQRKETLPHAEISLCPAAHAFPWGPGPFHVTLASVVRIADLPSEIRHGRPGLSGCTLLFCLGLPGYTLSLSFAPIQADKCCLSPAEVKCSTWFHTHSSTYTPSQSSPTLPYPYCRVQMQERSRAGVHVWPGGCLGN